MLNILCKSCVFGFFFCALFIKNALAEGISPEQKTKYYSYAQPVLTTAAPVAYVDRAENSDSWYSPQYFNIFDGRDIIFEPFLGAGYTFYLLDYKAADKFSYNDIMSKDAHGFHLKTGFVVNNRWLLEFTIGNIYGNKSTPGNQYFSSSKMNILSLGLDLGFRIPSGFSRKINYVVLAGFSSLIRNIDYKARTDIIPADTQSGGYNFAFNAGGGLEYAFSSKSSVRFDFRRLFLIKSSFLQDSWVGNFGIMFKF
jgi:hypothetical protein